MLTWFIALTAVGILASSLHVKDTLKIENPTIEDPSPGYWETSEYMIGSIAVGIIFLGSSGAIDSSSEDWNFTEERNIVDKVQGALSWWASRNPDANVSFVTEIHYRVPTSYEPINRPLGDLVLSISEALDYLGYRGENWDIQRRNYVNDLRKRLNTNWAFIIFIVDASNDADGRYADGSRSTSSFGGPSLQMPVKTTRILEWRVAHEVAHIFWATDEYNGETEFSGYLNVPDEEGSDCLMRNPVSGCLSGELHGLNGTWGQVGWRDLDKDGVPDILDTLPTILVNYSERVGNTLTITGLASVTPLENKNPYTNNPSGCRDVTVNTIRSVEYRINNGTWQKAMITPTKVRKLVRYPDTYVDSETYTTVFYNIMIPEIEPGNYSLEIKATNSIGSTGFFTLKEEYQNSY